ncbi:hypothetical protein SIID45300_02179 [Candidatus Magnetaquicoccaceae bacterium FCR-1]|uniref:Uncharacterized protein n=1 Tax=Candidatus Magnetaquiglobus chichijimensis TaxID=3141448 RepID=A0ABQ0CAW1_9PROT
MVAKRERTSFIVELPSGEGTVRGVRGIPPSCKLERAKS